MYIGKAAFLAFLFTLCQSVFAENAFKLLNHNSTIQVHVIEFAADENRDFELVDGGNGRRQYYVDQHYDATRHLFIVNGGYFDGNMKPVGYCKIGDEWLSKKSSESLSGYLLLNDSGQLEIRHKTLPKGTPHSVLQAGPLIIDPGGTVGIHSELGLPAKRTVVAITSDQRVLVMTTSEVTLYQFARFLKKQLPQIDRAINLDGGPSTGLIYQDIKVVNRNPVRNFLRKKRYAASSL